MISLLELACNGLNTASIALAGRNSVHTWWCGIAGCALFGVLFYQSQLYADATLQLFFIGTSVAGYRLWRSGRRGSELAISRAPRRLLFLLGSAALGVVLGYGALLHRFTDAYAPFVDSAILAFSVMGQLLLMRRCLETWACWLLVNTLAVPVFWLRGLHLTALLYAAYWLNALIAWRHWRGQLQARPASLEGAA